MTRAEDRAESADEDDTLSGSSDSGDDSDSHSDGSYDSDNSAGSSNSDGSEGEAEEEGEDDVKAGEAATAAKKFLVRADIDEMRAMMADMDAVKARLQQRFAVERQARLDRIAREDHEREMQDADRRKAEEEAHDRHLKAVVLKETGDSQQQTNLSQKDSCELPHLAEGACVAAATLPAVDGGAGVADAAPNNGKPARLSLYDLVKASGFGLSPKAHSTVRQAYPTRSLNEQELVSPEQQRQLHDEQPESAAKRSWGVADSRFSHGRDSVVNSGSGDDSDGGVTNRDRHHMQSNSGHMEPLNYDENSSSMSNSFASSDAGKRSALLPDPVPRQDHKLNAASSGRLAPTAPATNDKTDEQREMEAIQCLLFGHRTRR